MAAPKGNQFWKLRSKHGRDKLFTTPDLMWEAACEYFEWCEENPFLEVEQRKGNIIIPKGVDPNNFDLSPLVHLPKMRPFTFHGLCRYLDCNTSYFKNFRENLPKEDPNYEGFRAVLTRIEETLYEQKFSGAASGFLNPGIIARDLGLADKREVRKEKVTVSFKDAG